MSELASEPPVVPGAKPDPDPEFRASAADLREHLTRMPGLTSDEVVELLCADQAERWRRGERVPAEAYLALHPNLPDDADTFELVYSEFALREDLGEAPALAEFEWRFPGFAARLRRQLELRRAIQLDEDPMARPSTWRPAQGNCETVNAEADHQTWPAVPGYEIVGKLGHGGMGVVYKARQVRLRRLVALKMVAAGAHAGSEELARFRREAEVVARLQHPNIVQIYEVGEHDGRPFLALEYVDGGSLGAFLRHQPQPARPAAELVVTLARAVHHAHRQGIIHRDLKPANILLVSGGVVSGAWSADTLPTTHDSPLTTHQPKITDFGLAKSFPGEAGGRVSGAETLSGALLGTPEYMAPEQADGRRGAIGPATDVHGLGVILYELLTGRRPFHGDNLADTLALVRFTDPPPPRRLQPGVPRDLETICLRCLRKEPARRYASAEEFADDVERFLDNRPIQARPVGLAERAWKWARRRPAVAALLLLLALVIGGSVPGLTGLWLHARAQWDRAEANADQAVRRQQEAEASFQKARAAVDQLLVRVSEHRARLRDEPRMEELRRQLLEDALRFYQEFLAERGDDPAVRLRTASIQKSVGDIYGLLSRHGDAEGAYRRALDLLEPLVAEFPAVPAYRWELSDCQSRLGVVLGKTGAADKAAAAFQRAAEVLPKVEDQASETPETRRRRAARWNDLGSVLEDTGRLREAEQAYRRAADLQQQLVDEFPAVPDYRLALATIRNGIGSLMQQANDPAKAEEAFAAARDLRQRLVDEFPGNAEYRQHLADSHTNLASLLRLPGDHRRTTDAVAALRQALFHRQKLADDFPDVPDYRAELARTRNYLGGQLIFINDHDGAEKAIRQALDVQEKLAAQFPAVPDYRRDLAATYDHLGLLLSKTGRRSDAVPVHRHAATLWQRLADDFPRNATYRGVLVETLANLGAGLLGAGEVRDAEDVCRQAVSSAERLVKEFPQVATHRRLLASAHQQLGVVLDLTGQFREASEAFAEMLKHDPEDAQKQTTLALFLATCPDAQFRDVGRAVTLAKKAVARAPGSARTWEALGAAHYRAEDWSAAAGALQKAMTQGDRIDARTWFLLAMTQWKQGAKEQARASYDQALKWIEEQKPRPGSLSRYHVEAAALLGMPAPPSPASEPPSPP